MYSRTRNENGTYSTRCLDCFMAIASSVETDEELGWVEGRHLCPERVLSERMLEEEKSMEMRISREEALR